MAIQEKELHPIDQNLFRFNVMYQLRQVESNRALLYKENEKQVLEVLLKSCRDADGNKLRSIIDSIFNLSLQSIPSQATVMINRVSDTINSNESIAVISKATNISSKATALTSETPIMSIAKDVAQDGDTNTNRTLNIDRKQNDTYSSIIERQLFDPKMSKLSVKIKRHRKPTTKTVLPYKAVPDKEYNSSMENLTYQKIPVKRGKAHKRSCK